MHIFKNAFLKKKYIFNVGILYEYLLIFKTQCSVDINMLCYNVIFII